MSPAKKRTSTKTAKKPVKKPVKKPATKSAGKQTVTRAKAVKRAKPPKSSYYEVRRSKIQGRGAFAIRPIRKSTRIDEYFGERITHGEADRRYDDNDGRHHTFLFVLDDDVVLDARRGGTDARFINHSCDPNCETVIEDGRIWIKALKSITPETELAYDYRFEWQDEYEPEDIRYYACRCGTAKCRGTILRVPVYLRATVKKWLAGEDVRRPKKVVADKRAGADKRTGTDKGAGTGKGTRGR